MVTDQVRQWSKDRSISHATHTAGLICLLCYALLTVFVKSSPTDPEYLYGFLLFMAWGALPTFALFALCYLKQESPPLRLILLWAILFRCCGLIGGPILEDDYFRYLWDGFQFAQYGTPYGIPPSDSFAIASIPIEFQRILDQVNYPDIPTIYGPTNQLLFLLGYWIQSGEVWVLQALLIVFDLVIVLLLSRLISTPYLLLYAWCPLLIKEVAYTAHPDILGVALLLGSCLLRLRGTFWLAGVLLALAVGAKVFALLLAPFILKWRSVPMLLAFLLTLAVLYAPHLAQGVSEFPSLAFFAEHWQYNSFLYALLSQILTPLAAKLLLGGMACGIIFWYWIRFQSKSDFEVPRGDWIFGIFLLVAPVINPWYVLWILPFLVLYPSRWGWATSIVIVLAYVNYGNLGLTDRDPFALPVWVQVTEFTLITAFICWDIWDKRNHRIVST